MAEKDPTAELADRLGLAVNDYKSDKLVGAHRAVGAMLMFLKEANLPAELRTPILEALGLIEKELGITSLTKGVLDKVHGALALTYQLENGASMTEALKAVLGDDVEGKRQLKDFRGNMLGKRTPKGAYEYYYLSRSQAAERKLPPDKLAKLSLEFFKEKVLKS